MFLKIASCRGNISNGLSLNQNFIKKNPRNQNFKKKNLVNQNFKKKNLYKKELYGSGHDRKKLNTYLKSALKTVLKNGLRIYIFDSFLKKQFFLIQEMLHKLCVSFHEQF